MAALDYARLGRASASAAALRRPPRGDPRPEPRHLPLRLARRRRSARSGSAARARRGSTTSSRRSRASTPSDLDALAPDHFDVVIVDEFHHAAARLVRAAARPPRARRAARAYRDTRAQRRPARSCTGSTTASPPSCGCGTRSTSSTSSPFVYFGIHDGLDLREIPWRRGRGYDVERAERRLHQLTTHGPGWSSSRSQSTSTTRRRCAPRLLRQRRARPLHGRALQPRTASQRWRSGATAARTNARAPSRDLAAGRVERRLLRRPVQRRRRRARRRHVLMLRPTESPTLFLQQLGRGLRKAADKTFCTVLDFVGHAPQASSGSTVAIGRCSAARVATSSAPCKSGFPFLPAGCHMELDPKASEIVLRSLREAIPTRWPAKVEELRSLARAAAGLSISRRSSTSRASSSTTSTTVVRSWSDLREAAGAPVLAGRDRTRRHCGAAIGRLLHVDDDERHRSLPTPAAGRNCRRRLTRFPSASAACSTCSSLRLRTGRSPATRPCRTRPISLWEHPQVRAELLELLGVLDDRVDHVHRPLATHPDVAAPGPRPLHPHRDPGGARPRRRRRRSPPWQSGVYEARDAECRAPRVHARQEHGGFSPTTRYRDYAISRDAHPLGEPVGRPAPTAQPDCDTETTSVTAARFFCSRGSVRTIERSGSSVPRPTRPRRRAANGDHVGATAPVVRRPVPDVRRGGCLTAPSNSTDRDAAHQLVACETDQ